MTKHYAYRVLGLSAEASRCLYWGAKPSDMPLLIDEIAELHGVLLLLEGRWPS